MSRESSSGLEIACALLFAAVLWGFRASLFIARVARNTTNHRKGLKKNEHSQDVQSKRDVWRPL